MAFCAPTAGPARPRRPCRPAWLREAREPPSLPTPRRRGPLRTLLPGSHDEAPRLPAGFRLRGERGEEGAPKAPERSRPSPLGRSGASGPRRLDRCARQAKPLVLSQVSFSGPARSTDHGLWPRFFLGFQLSLLPGQRCSAWTHSEKVSGWGVGRPWVPLRGPLQDPSSARSPRLPSAFSFCDGTFGGHPSTRLSGSQQELRPGTRPRGGSAPAAPPPRPRAPGSEELRTCRAQSGPRPAWAAE